MSDKELSADSVEKEYAKVLKSTEQTLKDIEQALADMKAAEEGVSRITDALNISMARFNQFDIKNFHKAVLPKLDKENAIDIVQKILDVNVAARTKSSSKAAKDAKRKGPPTMGKRIRKKGIKI